MDETTSLRELMRELIRSQREEREYGEFLRKKVEAGRASMRAGRGRPHHEVEDEFAARRTASAEVGSCPSACADPEG